MSSPKDDLVATIDHLPSAFEKPRDGKRALTLKLAATPRAVIERDQGVIGEMGKRKPGFLKGTLLIAFRAHVLTVAVEQVQFRPRISLKPLVRMGLMELHGISVPFAPRPGEAHASRVEVYAVQFSPVVGEEQAEDVV